MTERLILCPECRRHVAARATGCPFCHAALDASKAPSAGDPRKRGATLAAALVGMAASACGAGDASTTPVTPANPSAMTGTNASIVEPHDAPPPPPKSDASDAGAPPPAPSAAPSAVPDAGKRGVTEPSVIYGGPPPR